MNLGTDERERPCEWLRHLKESAGGYRDLVRESGDRLVAAYRIAVARCRASSHATAVPTAREVHAALCELSGRTGSLSGGALPSLRGLIADCHDAGLLVHGPAARAWIS